MKPYRILISSLIGFAAIGICVVAAKTHVPSVANTPAITFNPESVRDQVSASFRSHKGTLIGIGQHHRAEVDQQAELSLASGTAALKFQPAQLHRGDHVLALTGAPVLANGKISFGEGGVTEELENRPEGVEQSFRFKRAPEGTGELRVQVGTSATKATATEDGVRMEANGARFQCSQALWRDANGKQTPIPVRWEDGALVMAISEETLKTSSYPAVLDPLLSAEAQLTTPVASTFAGGGQESTAFDGTNFLVVWADDRLGGFNNDILLAARVTPTGTVLDPGGIFITPEDTFAIRSPVVSFDGTQYVIAWIDSRISQSTGLGKQDVFSARVSTSGQVLDGNNLRLTAASEDAQGIAIASNGTVSLVTWSLGLADKVVGERVSKSGQLLDSPRITIESGSNTLEHPEVASNGTDFFVVWSRYQPSPANRDLYGKRVSGAGTVLSSTAITIATANGDQIPYDVDYDPGASQYFVVWEDRRTTPRDVYGARVSSTGTVLDPNGIQLSTNATADEYQPRVEFDGTQHRVIWTRIGGGSVVETATVSSTGTVSATSAVASSVSLYPLFSYGAGHLFIAFNGVGPRIVITDTAVAPQTGATSIAGTTYGGFQDNARATFDGMNYVVAWPENRGATTTPSVLAARVSSAGSSLDPNGLVLSSTGGNPSIASSGSESLVVWRDSSNNKAIHAKTISGSGTVGADQVAVLAPITAVDPAVAWDGTKYVLAWADRTFLYGGSAPLHVLRRGANDPTINDGGFATIPANALGNAPAIAMNGDEAFIAWSNYGSGTSFDIVATKFGVDGGTLWPAPLTIANTTGDEEYPRAAFSNGQYAVAWHSYLTDGGVHSYVARVSPSGTVIDSPPKLLGSLSGQQTYPAIIGTAEGFLVAWEDNSDGGIDLHGAKLFADGGLSAPFAISEQFRDEHRPALVAGSGNFLAAYARLVEASPTANRAILAKTMSWKAIGTSCSADGDCGSGFCVDGVCCNSACGGNATDDCQACSAAAGASADGTCTALSARSCSDHDACTQTDTCQSGVCQGSNPVVCPAPAACHTAGVCNSASGACNSYAAQNGTNCDDGEACTEFDSCQNGQCVGTAITCTPAECQETSSCNATSGSCDTTPAADGTPCSIGTCSGGVCVASSAGGGSGGGSGGGAGGGGGASVESKPCGCSSGPAAMALWSALLAAALLRRKRA